MGESVSVASRRGFEKCLAWPVGNIFRTCRSKKPQPYNQWVVLVHISCGVCNQSVYGLEAPPFACNENLSQ